MVHRRSFIFALAAGVVPSANSVWAQKRTVTPARIGVLQWYRPEADSFAMDFEQRLNELGLIAGRDVLISYDYAKGDPARAASLARELVEAGADVIVAQTTPAAHAVKAATTSIPIVIQSADAIRAGLVASLAKPGGNLTGVSTASTELSGKRIEFLHDLVPGLMSLAFLGSANDTNGIVFADESEAAGARIGLRVRRFLIDGPHELAPAFATMTAERLGAVVVQPILVDHAAMLSALALRHRLPSVADQKDFAQAGILAAYGIRRRAIHRMMAEHTAKIIKGAKPADIPVEQPIEYDLVVNLKTAAALGITIPPSILIRADEVIE